MLEALGVAFLLFGLFFCAVGVLGVLRFPDALTRLHASGKVAILGLFGILVGAGILMPSAIPRLLTLALFVLLTSPVATHAIAAADYRRRETVKELERDEKSRAADTIKIDVTGVLTRTRVDEILAAHERALRRRSQHKPDESG